MATTNLYLVTDSLRRLLQLNMEYLLSRQNNDANVEVTTMPPERVDGAQDTINLHLYHVMEDVHYRNLPTPGSGGGLPISRQPLALSLFYILTAHHELNEVWDAARQQNLFSLAIKTMHDHSRIDDDLQIAPDGANYQNVMAPGLQGRQNHFEISPRPLTPEEAMAFWSAEQTATTRLSAYYEVRTIFLDAEEPTSIAGRVYDIGLFVAPISAPVLEAVTALTSFTPPPGSGLPPQQLQTSPARAILDPSSDPATNVIRLRGSGFTGSGEPGASQIVLRCAAWRDLAAPVREAVIDPQLNPAWKLTIGPSEASFAMQDLLLVRIEGVNTPLEVTPGIYAVSIRTSRRQATAAGVLRSTTAESNQIAFSAGAHIIGVISPNPQGQLAVQIGSQFNITQVGVVVQLLIDSEIYDEAELFTGDPAQDEGRFVRQAGEIVFYPLFDPTVGTSHSLRLIINGAESQPFWFET